MANTSLTYALSRAAPVGRQHGLWWDLKHNRAAYLLLAPFIIYFLVVIAYPFFYSVYLSFFDATLNRAPVFVGFANFVRLAQDPQFRRSSLASSFLAMLELARRGRLEFAQEAAFAPIRLRAA